MPQTTQPGLNIDYNSGNMYGAIANVLPYPINEGQSEPPYNIPPDIPPPSYDETMANKHSDSNMTEPLITNITVINISLPKQLLMMIIIITHPVPKISTFQIVTAVIVIGMYHKL